MQSQIGYFYHQNCFQCVLCNVEIEPNEQFWARKDGSLYCTRHDIMTIESLIHRHSEKSVFPNYHTVSYLKRSAPYQNKGLV
ncbi:hypothetical protein GJ496_011909 [Pomphorhynchus laevis]|nr:hypothetical protein GJ496_011909 [Pomphorhynchus laevis]